VNLYPAIDILGGNAVRLIKGDFGSKTVYDDDPLSAARAFTEAGARFLHVVDLDGARSGAPVNLEHLRGIARELGVPVQYGGGLRSPEAVRDAFAAGAARVILGTAALEDRELLLEVLDAHGPERVVVSVDVRGGRVATAGWTQSSGSTTATVLERLQDSGVQEFVYTNVDRDGMLEGPDLQEVDEVAAAVRGRVVYSGGIAALTDLHGLAALRRPSLEGVIVGKALYEARFTVAEALAALAG
jgi:phosphoribosylformimino-5-aminoimidazole carboxamide ribotide isomerase